MHFVRRTHEQTDRQNHRKTDPHLSHSHPKTVPTRRLWPSRSGNQIILIQATMVHKMQENRHTTVDTQLTQVLEWYTAHWNCIIRQIAYEFLFVFHCNYGYRFRDKANRWSNTPNFHTVFHLSCTSPRTPCEFLSKCLTQTARVPIRYYGAKTLPMSNRLSRVYERHRRQTDRQNCDDIKPTWRCW